MHQLGYAYLYPFAEGLAGVLMLARAIDWLSIPVALFIGSVGAVSVFYAVYVQKREIKCACVGGKPSRLPTALLRPHCSMRTGRTASPKDTSILLPIELDCSSGRRSLARLMRLGAFVTTFRSAHQIGIEAAPLLFA